jgi:D-psicose/D-tagatose/L-ribulose 3-epimerase
VEGGDDRVNLAVSNIAWDASQDAEVAELLRREQVGGVEIAPTKWRARPTEASSADIAAYRREWEDRGLPIVSIQSLLFGRPDLQLFGDGRRRADMLDYLRRIIELSAALGARTLVFGSPKNRLRGSLPMADAVEIARDFLRSIGDHARDHGVTFCVEANPPAYGCDFITTTGEAVDLCRVVDHPAIQLNADLGGITMSNEDVPSALTAAAPYIGHFHASEPNLDPFGVAADHEAAAAALDAIRYRGWVSIEMRAVEGTGATENVVAVEGAVRQAKRAYGRVI